MRYLWLLAAVGLGGCVRTAPVMAPDGSHGILISNCNDSQACYEKAAEICPRGYNVFDRQNQTWAYVPAFYGTRAVNQQELFISCRQQWREISPGQWGWAQ